MTWNLTHHPLDKMGAFTQTIFSDAFSWMKSCVFFIKISPKFVPKSPIDNNTALVKIMAWRRIGDKPLSDPNADPIHWRIYAALGEDDLKSKYHSMQWKLFMFCQDSFNFVVGIIDTIMFHITVNSVQHHHFFSTLSILICKLHGYNWVVVARKFCFKWFCNFRYIDTFKEISLILILCTERVELSEPCIA